MPSQIKAKLISQLPQKHGYWLINIELLHVIELNIGARLTWQNNQAWLFQQQHNELTLLSLQEWTGLNSQQQIALECGEYNLNWSAKADQLWLGSNLSQAAVFDAGKRWHQTPHPKGRFIALLHADAGFAFQPKPASFMLNLAPEAIGASPLLEDWRIPNRLASSEDLPGCLEGSIVSLYQAWLSNLDPQQDWKVYGFLPEKDYQACLNLSQNHANIIFTAQIQ